MPARTVSILLLVTAVARADDEFLTKLYDSLHDSPMQQKIRELAPVPFGPVFIAWAGMTELQAREQFRTMKKLGFNNLKQVAESPEWPEAKLLELALEEDLIPFWYGEGGWEPSTPALLDKLGIPKNLSKTELRAHPKMRAYQKEIIRRQIHTKSKKSFLGEDAPFVHAPDPFLRNHDVPHFQKWLRSRYKSPDEITRSWNLLEVNHQPAPFKSWADVDSYVASMPKEENSLRGYGREFSRVRDVLHYKADGRTATVREVTREAHNANPLAPTRTGGEMGLFLPFAWRAIRMEDLAETQREVGSFYPSIHFVWHFGEVHYEVARPIYMQVSFSNDMFKGGWAGAWESTGGPQQLSGSKGWGIEDGSTTPGFTVDAGTITQLFLSYLAGGFKGAGIWAWNHRKAGIEAGEYALVDRNFEVTPRAIRAGKISQAAERLRDEIWQTRKEPQVGVLLNWDSDAIWAAASVRNRDHFRHYPMQARVGVSRALINGNVPWEYVTVDDLRNGLGPRYKTVYLAAQMALTDELLDLLTKYAEGGGRVVLDTPSGIYDQRGVVLPTGTGSRFERLFGAKLADLQYSNNTPRSVEGQKLDGFVSDLIPTRAKVLAKFDAGEPAVTEAVTGKGSAVIIGYDASYAAFRPGNTRMEERMRRYALNGRELPYRCDGAVVYRTSAPAADHYFFINDDKPKSVTLTTKWKYKAVTDPVSGERLEPGKPIALEGYSGRWLRFEK